MEYFDFIDQVQTYYVKNKRDMPWRRPSLNGEYDPYAILVSEVMLQQTRVGRVIPKYEAFLQVFPDAEALAQAELGDVLRQWSGLGYNRRAKFLWQAAHSITTEFGGDFPKDQKRLITLPGVGVNTAGALRAYAFNVPVVFIETNIRTVFIHHYFANSDTVDDKELRPYIQATLDEVLAAGGSVREWYWALMDYGTYLKTEVGNVSRSSRHYAKQSRFQGSRRQVRGLVLKMLAVGAVADAELAKRLSDERLQGILDDLLIEGLITQTQTTDGLHRYQLSDHRM